MGKVFLAKDLKTGKKVAVKILKDENQWKREKEILNQLKNIKGIPKLFLAENTKDHFLVMEYIKGQSLKTYKTVHGKISEKTLILLMYKVCKVLEQVHKRGVVHMDLKPENIILHPSGRLYLIDFGASSMKGDFLTGYGTRIYASKRQTKAGERAEFFMDVYSIGKIIQLNTEQNKKYPIENIIQKCLCEDEKKNYQSARDIKRDLRKIVWKSRSEKSVVFLACIGMIGIFGFTDSHKEEKLKVQSVKTYEDFYKKGMVYFYGNERTEKDLTLAGQYFKKEETNKKKTEAYLLLIEVLNDPEKEVKQDELVSALEICQKDVHDFWLAYFFIDHYILWQEKLPEFVVKKAEKLLYKTEKFRLKEEQKKMLEKQKINLYEIKAKRGDDKLFFQETDRVFHEKLEKNEAWEIYERKLSYLREKSVNIENEYERFIKHYPKVMEAYIEYGIYLCQKNQIEKAKDVYLQGLKQTGMTSNRAKALRRKLGL